MIVYEAPAKLNLSLLVSPPSASGMHPLQSLVQTIDLLDRLEFHDADEDSFRCDRADLHPEDNLVMKALRAVRERGVVPPRKIVLDKSIPLEAGLGGGSSDAAAALVAAIEVGALSKTLAEELASLLGADVPLFLTGGTQMMTGFGDHLESLPPLQGFAVALVVPGFGLSTADVYRRWDELEGPEGDAIPDELLPPALRGGIPIRNDLVAAALDLEPELGDFMVDARETWDAPVAMTGSGSTCFGFFGDVEEAVEAAEAVTGTKAGFGVELRDHGVKRLSDDEDEQMASGVAG